MSLMKTTPHLFSVKLARGGTTAYLLPESLYNWKNDPDDRIFNLRNQSCMVTIFDISSVSGRDLRPFLASVTNTLLGVVIIPIPQEVLTYIQTSQHDMELKHRNYASSSDKYLDATTKMACRLYNLLHYMILNDVSIRGVNVYVPPFVDRHDIENLTGLDWLIGQRSVSYGKSSEFQMGTNFSNYSNGLRYNVLSIAKHYNKSGNKIYYVGWHLLSLYMSMIINMDLHIIDAYKFDNPSKLTFCGSLVKSRTYIPPNSEIKLSALSAYAVNKYDLILYVGSFPGLEIKKLFNYVRRHNKLIIMIDPQYSGFDTVHESCKFKSAVQDVHSSNDFSKLVPMGIIEISGAWDFDSSVDENLDRLDLPSISQFSLNFQKMVVLDDAWSSEVDMNKMLEQKLNNLIPVEGMDILIKFNIYDLKHVDVESFGCSTLRYDSAQLRTLKNIRIHKFDDFILLPGMNDSNEGRILLSNTGKHKTIKPVQYLLMMQAWRNLSQSEQAYAFGYYFKDVIFKDSIYNSAPHYIGRDDTIISLFALGGVSHRFNMLDFLTYCNENYIKFYGNFYTQCNHDELIIKYKKYQDCVYPVTELIKVYKIGYIGIIYPVLFNLLSTLNLPCLGIRYSGDLGHINDAFNYERARLFLTNVGLPQSFEIQNSASSLGYRIKAMTVYLRSQRFIDSMTTYVLRHDCLERILHTSGLGHDSGQWYLEFDKAEKCSVFKTRGSNRKFCFALQGNRLQSVVGYDRTSIDITLTRGERIHISGHLLNIIINELLQPGSLALWLNQFISYHEGLPLTTPVNGGSILTHMPSGRHKYTEESYLKEWALGSYFETAQNDVCKVWHTKNEMILAALIAVDYWSQLFNLSENEIMVIAQLADFCYSCFS